MSLFRRTKAVPPPVPAALDDGLTVDPSYGDQDAAIIRSAMAAADWPTVQAVLRAGYDDDDLTFLVNVASRVPDSEIWLPDVVRADLDDPLPLLVYGVRAIDWAWEARTNYRANYVTSDRFELFFERLRLAEDCLQDVVKRDPSNITALAGLITLGRGLQLGMDEKRRRYERAVAVSPFHVRSHDQMLQNVCRKWSGSHETMHAFARDAVAAAPPGSRLGALIAWAHIEEWFDLAESGGQYFKNSMVLAQLRYAADRSVRHPHYRRGKGSQVDHNMFAMAFALAGDQFAAAEQFRIIGDQPTEFPWAYQRRLESFVARRKTAYAAVAAAAWMPR